MLTRSDQTVPDCLEVLDEIRPLGLGHIGFKDVGVPPEVLRELVARIQATRRDELHGGREHVERGVLALGAGRARHRRRSPARRHAGRRGARDPRGQRGTTYLPFPGRPFEHPTKLGGTPRRRRSTIAGGSRRRAAPASICSRIARPRPIRSSSCARRGAARRATARRRQRRDPAQIRALAAAGADAFTIGSAAFDGSFSPLMGSLRSQLRAILDACR